MKSEQKEFVDRMTKKLMDDGKIVEAGWVAYLHMLVPKTAGPAQIADTRKAFYCGCQHLFASLATGCDDGQEVTDEEIKRMENIDKELKEFVEFLKAGMG